MINNKKDDNENLFTFSDAIKAMEPVENLELVVIVSDTLDRISVSINQIQTTHKQCLQNVNTANVNVDFSHNKDSYKLLKHEISFKILI